jgi:hypothetical protein
MYHRFITTAKNSLKKGLQSFSKTPGNITATSLQKLTPDIIGYTGIYSYRHKIPYM